MRIGIVGGGVFGTATAWEASKRGHDVTLFERGIIPSPRAASNDISKATRLEYGPLTPRYAPLVDRSFALWREAEEKSRLSFFHNTGVLCLARNFSEGGFAFESCKHLEKLGHTVELLQPGEGAKRFPQFNWSKLEMGCFHEKGGWLASALATEGLARCAQLEGTKVCLHSEVESVDEGVIVVNGMRHDFDLVVVAAGAWVGKLLPKVEKSARVSRQRMTFYKPTGGFNVPVWIHDPAQSGWYGFPMNSDGVVKVALHQRSETVDPEASREIDKEFLEQSRQFVKDMMPGLDVDSLEGGKCCFYTNSPSGDLVFEKMSDRLYLAGLGSGHGFKFGPVLGQLALDCIEQDSHEFHLKESPGSETW